MSKGMKDLFVDEIDNYTEAKRQAFLDLIIGITESYMDSCDPYDFEPSLEELYEDSDIEFEFKEQYDWINTKIANDKADAEEAKFESDKEINF